MRVDSPGELIDACQAFVRSPRARGRRVAVIADGGGHGSVAADLLAAERARGAARSPPRSWRASSPQLEQAGGVATRSTSSTAPTGWRRSRASRARAWSRARSTRCCSRATTAATRSTATTTARTSRARRWRWPRCSASSTGRSSSIRCSPTPSATAPTCARSGLAAYERSEQAARAVAALATPPPQARGRRARPPPPPLQGAPGYVEARALLLDAGIAYGDGGPARDADEAVALADRLALYPVTLKAVDATLVHKSDAGGVRVGLADAAALRDAALEMTRRLAPDLLFVERTADVAQRRRARRRRDARRALRRRRPRRPRRDPGRDAARHRARARAAGRRGRRAAAALAARGRRARRRARPPRRRRRRGRARRRRARRLRWRRTPRSPSSRSTPCSSRRTAPSRSTRASP